MEKNLKEMRLKAEGIVCTGCAEDMENILLDKEGIEEATVSFIDDFIEVKYDADVIDRKNVFLAVRKLGFPVKIISES
ncbi:MAG: heavy-metal-associated domain-containing protein [Nitrospiraceae bacterium]|nr:MAG: heavy-metal-associated domain-containing protein [Nitrospiraceae bacterium]